MKLIKLLAALMAFGFVFSALAAAGGFWYLTQSFTQPGPLQNESFIIVDRGDSLGLIAEKLQGAGAINQPLVFKLGVRLAEEQGNLKAGEYKLTPQISPSQIMMMMAEGNVYRRQFTVPEGLTSHEVVQILSAVSDLGGEITDIPPEGSLLPETYSYQKGDTKLSQLHTMQIAMESTVRQLCLKYLPLSENSFDVPYCWPKPLKSIHEVITLASIVEKETGKPEERRRIAGVFINRLLRGIPLQTDPTVIYAITEGKHQNEGQGPLGRRLLKKDLEIDSPYNTYKYAGLPPGPIANPGLASIEAVLNPEKHDYIYFVADGTGGHVFSKSLAEHNQNAAEWRKIRREQNSKAKEEPAAGEAAPETAKEEPKPESQP